MVIILCEGSNEGWMSGDRMIDGAVEKEKAREKMVIVRF